jgi:hypothetical protein
MLLQGAIGASHHPGTLMHPLFAVLVTPTVAAGRHHVRASGRRQLELRRALVT